MAKDPEQPSPASPRASDPAPSGEGSSPVSPPASETSEFVADPGPAFDPETAPPATPINAGVPRTPPPAEAPAPIVWEEDTVEALLKLKGRGLHAALGVGEQDWLYTELDLAAIAPALTRICNRYEPIAQLAQHSDPLLLAFAFGGYGLRSIEERRRVLAAEYPDDDGGVPEEALPSPETAVPVAPPPAPAAPTPPRQSANFPTGPGGPPPAQPTEQRPPAPPPRPAEAPIDPQAVDWQVQA